MNPQYITDSKQINLSSSSSIITNGTYNSQLYFICNGFLNYDKDIVYSTISIVHAQLPVSYYIVNYTNNILVINNISYTLQVGNYNANTFKTMLLNILPTGFTLSLNGANSIYSLGYTTNFTINTNSTCHKIMGFVKNTEYNSTANNITFPFSCNFLGIQRIKIKSSVIQLNHNYDTLSNGKSSILTTIPVSAQSNGIILYQNITNFKSIINNLHLDNLDISICDENDNLINFNGLDVYITLQLDSYRMTPPIKETLHDLLQKNKN